MYDEEGGGLVFDLPTTSTSVGCFFPLYISLVSFGFSGLFMTSGGYGVPLSRLQGVTVSRGFGFGHGTSIVRLVLHSMGVLFCLISRSPFSRWGKRIDWRGGMQILGSVEVWILITGCIE